MHDEEIPATSSVLDHRTCLLLLATERVGRLVMGEPALSIVPVRYAVNGDLVTIVGIDGTVPLGRPHDLVLMEVDGINEERRAGWSVVVRGRLEMTAGGAEVTLLELTGRWVSAPRPLPPLDGRAYL